jgi:glycosyltransferase involved in cell wall biosynthesis
MNLAPSATRDTRSAPRPPARKRVLIVINTLRSGGSERFVQTLSRHLAGQAVSVGVVVFAADRQHYSLDPRVERIDLHRRSSHHVLRLCWRLRNAVLRFHPDAVLSVLTPVTFHTAIACLTLRSAPPLFARETMFHSATKKGVSRAAYSALFRVLFSRCRAVVCPAREMCADLRDTFGVSPGLLRQIPNPVDIAECLALARQPVEHPFFLNPAEPVVVMAARLDFPKDYDTVLRAVKEVNRRMPCRFLALGEGRDRDRLIRLRNDLGLQDRVEFPGPVGNPFPFMSRAAVCVLSSVYEGMPNAILEAMACDTPVISTDCPSGPREIITHGETGLLVPVGDSHSLAQAIADLLANPQARRAMADRAAAMLRRTHSVELIAQRYLDLMFPAASPGGRDG